MNKLYLKIFFCFLIIILLPAQTIPDISNNNSHIRFGCIEDSFGDCCEAPFEVWFDNDNDGLGDPDFPALACMDYAGWVTNNSDLNDNCFSNEIDCADNCDGSWIEDQFGMCCSELQTFWQDLDGDGLGNPNISMEACEEPEGWSSYPVDLMDNCFSNIKDCLRTCDGTAYYDACGVCDDISQNDSTSCVGCMDEEAINYDPDALVDSENCIYPSDHIWHVSVSGSDDTGTGTVENPFETINHTIGVAVTTDTILVHTGTYYENINYSGKNILICSMFYFTDDTSFISLTSIDGGQNGSVVTIENGEDNNAILSGFTLTNGYGNFRDPDGNGVSRHLGGGIYCDGTEPMLEYLIVNGNFAEGGGGIYLGNDSSLILLNSSIINNTVTGYGGGIRCENSNSTFSDLIIKNNSADSKGGGVYIVYSNPFMINSKIIDNSINSWHAGGLYIGHGSDPILQNLLISGNSGEYGGGVSCDTNTNPVFINTTITANVSVYGGGILCILNSNPIFINSILWDNSPQEIYLWDSTNSIALAYSDIQGGEYSIVNYLDNEVNWMEGNIDSDPFFLDINNESFSLSENSPCIDTGTDYFEYQQEILLNLLPEEYEGYNPDMGSIESEFIGLEGDVNHDEDLNVLDIILIVNFILELDNLTDYEQWIGDLNDDGEINILDIIILISLILQGG
ncbi:MAG: DUF1565 domain-containing protein [Candidatus Marinimicrobia bacterium]|jgi:hypothetical protein|nr:DUF1565 domain-containing protein [Candidatus Neomarinimicrobiota bacterium]MBT3633494.1 DUF1565 domain-containing protein [Candidatus Neomarinimicrobiota bacterium]MBT3681636.1 DUF1565 domain-containing protein [Candidatus Neomarinimicrobiota bacterium]MBT3758396.1 DUF1565 domain-containing protein [Candidatus Neomarinimicrobiota bacterium]MBT3894950.1 DUF1565 domain-containing protein [Candidatus Neomarinimicrobiota bacterium]